MGYLKGSAKTYIVTYGGKEKESSGRKAGAEEPEKAKAADPNKRFNKVIKLDIWILAVFWFIVTLFTVIAQRKILRIILFTFLNTVITLLLFAGLYGFGKLSLRIRMAMKKGEGTTLSRAIKSFLGVILLIVIGLLLFLSMMVFLFYQPYLGSLSEPQSCSTNACFASAADSCESVEMTRNEDFGTVKYAAKDCVFTKTIVSANENAEMKRLLEGKSLSCTYEEGNFDRRLLTSMIEGIDSCTGDLKGVIGELLIFA